MTLDGKNALFCRKDASLRAHCTNMNKDRPIQPGQKCSPMILVSGNLGFMGIFVGVRLGGGVKWEWGGRRRQFLAIWMTTFSESSEIRPAILHDDMLTLVGRKMTAKKCPWMTWVAICRENPFSASTLLQQRCVFWSPLHKFEWR